MSGIDRPTGGDSDPDRYFKREDRPFPRAPADREPVSAPGAVPSMEQMRAAYARAGSSAELEAMAKADEAAAARGTRTPDPGSPGETPTEAAGESAAPRARTGAQDGDAVGTAVPESSTERDAGTREQESDSSEQAGSRQAQEYGGTNEQPAEGSRAEATPPWRKTPGSPGADPPSVDVQHHPGQMPATETHRTGDRGLITYAHAEFHGQKFGAYTDGTHWVSEEAVRAMGSKNEQSKAPERHGITDFPQQRDLGDNTVGENPDVHLGDTSDLRTFSDRVRGEAPFAQDLGEKDDSASGKAGRALDALIEHGDDIHDAVSSETETANDFFLHGPGPTGAYALHSDRPTYEAAPSQGLNPGDAVGGTVLVIAAAMATARHVLENRRRDH